MASKASTIWARSEAVRMPTCSSARAKAWEPRISASSRRRSKSSEPEKRSKISEGPDSKRPPQSFIGRLPGGLGTGKVGPGRAGSFRLARHGGAHLDGEAGEVDEAEGVL